MEDGKPWIVYEWRHRALGRVEDSAAKPLFLVDPKTKLPRFWDVESVEGATRRREFDYPDSGPADILAMGVPADSRRVDRVPGDDLDRLLKGMAAGRNRFDDYQGFAWNSDAWRVFRKGRKWRVEHAVRKVRVPTGYGFPAKADLAWWRTHEQDYHFELQAVCDGRSVWYYRYPLQRLEAGKNDVPEKPSSVMSHKVYGSDDDPTMPWPHLLPEQIGHPQVDRPSAERAFLIDPRPTDGPPHSVRLSVRDTNADDPKQPDVFRLWIDPEKNFLAPRSETSVFDRPHDAAGNATGPWKVVQTQVNILEDFARSPGGFWYPTLVRHQTPVNEFNEVQYGDTVTRFALDFKAPLPEDLFQELVVPGVVVK